MDQDNTVWSLIAVSLSLRMAHVQIIRTHRVWDETSKVKGKNTESQCRKLNGQVQSKGNEQ